MTDPNNTSTEKNPVGRFMVAAGAIIELNDSGKILILQQSSKLDWQPSEWEIPYGRLDQFEDAETGLRREMKEELGIRSIEIVKVIRVWHIFRGSKKADNELIGITYHCRTKTEKMHLSDEHEEYQWVAPEEALTLVKVKGIRRDIEQFIRFQNLD